MRIFFVSFKRILSKTFWLRAKKIDFILHTVVVFGVRVPPWADFCFDLFLMVFSSFQWVFTINLNFVPNWENFGYELLEIVLSWSEGFLGTNPKSFHKSFILIIILKDFWRVRWPHQGLKNLSNTFRVKLVKLGMILSLATHELCPLSDHKKAHIPIIYMTWQHTKVNLRPIEIDKGQRCMYSYEWDIIESFLLSHSNTVYNVALYIMYIDNKYKNKTYKYIEMINIIGNNDYNYKVYSWECVY